LLSEDTKLEIRTILSDLTEPVEIKLFTKKDCPTCDQQNTILKELVILSNKLKLSIHQLELNQNIFESFNVDKTPATVLISNQDYGIRFYGLTAGHEYASLLNSIILVSRKTSGLDPQIEALIKNVKEKVNIEVMVTLTCPFCPQMVQMVHKFALINDNITGEMVESSQFIDIAQRYNVIGVPKTIINGKNSLEGVVSPVELYLEILKEVDPEEYIRIENTIREYQGLRKVMKARENHDYEILIIGGGPAGMSATVYAARKGLDVALISEKLGGQITDTANIDNYLGIPDIIGTELNNLFYRHIDKYPIDEAINTFVYRVEKKKDKFNVFTDDGRQYNSFSVVFCAGQKYKRLGVPGEERLIGKGIGFCATCDAPLYRGKKVAVIGGGNTVFTLVRDLRNFASEIHVIHRSGDFTADKALIEEALTLENFFIHNPMVVRGFLGEDKLEGVRLESMDGLEEVLFVDGVFLGIGLSPNTSSLVGLVDLNEVGEVIVDRYMTTSLEGFFAAGDVTDFMEKQVSIAVGQGAMAAISAHRYLYDKKLTKKNIVEETWEERIS
jgi:alkyl hydroperoxide reductase subunit F